MLKRYFMMLLVLAMIAGCATNQMSQKTEITIEKVDSSSVKITHAFLKETGDGLVLSGEVKRKHHSHSAIPGHLHLELIQPNGDVVNKAEIHHTRKANSDHIAVFKIILPTDLAEGTVVRVVHHDAKSHQTNEHHQEWDGHRH